jgi:hypothetical protein
MNHAPKYLTKAQQRFTMAESFARNQEACEFCKIDHPFCRRCGNPTPGPEISKPEPNLVRGSFILRRDGDTYSGTLKLYGFNYVIAAEVAEDAQGRHFRGVACDDMTRQTSVEFDDLPVAARDPRLNASQSEMLTEIHRIFLDTPKSQGK